MLLQAQGDIGAAYWSRFLAPILVAIAKRRWPGLLVRKCIAEGDELLFPEVEDLLVASDVPFSYGTLPAVVRHALRVVVSQTRSHRLACLLHQPVDDGPVEGQHTLKLAILLEHRRIFSRVGVIVLVVLRLIVSCLPALLLRRDELDEGLLERCRSACCRRQRCGVRHTACETRKLLRPQVFDRTCPTHATAVLDDQSLELVHIHLEEASCRVDSVVVGQRA